MANETIGLPPDTVVICWENAETLHLKQILGIEAGGEYITDAVVGNYLKKADLLNIFAGAVFFDGKKAYEDLLSNPAYKYAGDKTTGNAIKVKITYTVNDSNSCLNGKSYVLILILTDELVS